MSPQDSSLSSEKRNRPDLRANLHIIPHSALSYSLEKVQELITYSKAGESDPFLREAELRL